MPPISLAICQEYPYPHMPQQQVLLLWQKQQNPYTRQSLIMEPLPFPYYVLDSVHSSDS